MIEITYTELIIIGLLWLASMVISFYIGLKESENILNDYKKALSQWGETIQDYKELHSNFKELLELYKDSHKINMN